MSFPTSYIKTEGAAVTRSADNGFRTLGKDFNASEGTVVFDFKIAENRPEDVSIISLNTSTTVNTQPREDYRILPSGELTISGGKSGVYINEGVKNKGAMYYTRNTYSIALNGGICGITNDTDTSGIMYLTIGNLVEGLLQMTGVISNVRYIPRALSAESLEILTAPDT